MKGYREHVQSSSKRTASAEEDAVRIIFLITVKKGHELQNTLHSSLSLLGKCWQIPRDKPFAKCEQEIHKKMSSSNENLNYTQAPTQYWDLN